MRESLPAQAQPTPDSSNRLGRAFQVASRFPFTSLLLAVIIVAGIAFGTMIGTPERIHWLERFSTGLPALQDGRWWTLVTAGFLSSPPIFYVVALPLIVVQVGWCEWRFGWLRTCLIFGAGHLIGFLGSAGVLALLAPTGWRWAVDLSGRVDAGPSCGAFAALVFAVSTLPSPWRLRARFALGLWVLVTVFYPGHLYDLEHGVSIVAALVATRFSPGLHHVRGRPTLREWRLLGLVLLVVAAALEILDFLEPYSGPLGRHHFHGHAVLILVDVVVIALLAHGLRRGLRAAWVMTIALACTNLAAHALLLTRISSLVASGAVVLRRDVVGAVLPAIMVWFMVLVFVWVARGAFRVPWRLAARRRTGRALSRESFLVRLRALGGSTMSWMTTWEANRYLPVGNGAVAFQSARGVSIMLGDPIVAADQAHVAMTSFAEATQRAGQIPCVFCAGADVEAVKPLGWRSVQVAEDTLIDLPGLCFSGKRWQDVRTAFNHARRQGVEFRLVRLAEQPWSIQTQVRAISEQWAGDKGLPEMRFTLGTIDEAMDPEVWVAIAVDAGGSLHGVISWLPVYAPGGHITGWTLDLMRRREGGFGPVMEFLIGSSALEFSRQGYQFVSLSGAPLVSSGYAASGPVDQALARLGAMVEPLYGFQSLHHFKQKFHPRHEPLYLLYRDEGDLPRIGLAVVRAYLPDTTIRQMVSTARELRA
jgi:lysylphosphatidylglycerol synthetase-like protein (DUF2156 family)